MGIFNFAMKGVTLEKRNRGADKAQTPDKVEVSLPTPTAHEQAAAVLFNFNQPSSPAQSGGFGAAAQQFAPAFGGGTLGNRHILVVNPKNDNEVIGIVEHLKTNEAVIVNFEGISAAETQRRIDFLSGVACGLGGAICKLDDLKYIITPSGIGVR